MGERSHRRVWMVGPALQAPGGMSAVAQAYREAGLFDRWGVRYLSSYAGPGLLRQLATMLPALARLAGALLLGRVALVHVHSASRGSFWRKSVFCAVARLAGVPYVVHLHSGEFTAFYHRECSAIGRRWVRRVLRQAAAVIVLAPHWAREVAAIEPAAALRVVANPVVLPPVAQAVRAPARRLLFLGRLREKKGVFDLLAALPALRERHPGLRLCLAGDGDLDAVRRAASALGVADAVELPGWIDGAAKDAELRRADVLVLPSHFEGLPMCVLEAMAAGVPVVATAVGGVPFALDEGRCGALVPPGDVPALAQAVLRLFDDAGHRRQLAQAARERAAALFATGEVLRQVEATWRDALAPRPMTVLLVASGGGHWVQLTRLAPAFAGFDLAFVTVQADYAGQVPAGARFHVVRDATRWDRWGLLVLAWQLLRIVWRERPQLVVTTGAAPGFIALAIARRLGARTIWIDSIANVERLSLSGERAGRVADVWLTQWESLARPDGPDCRGSVL